MRLEWKRTAGRGDLTSPSFWDERAEHPGLSRTMWLNPAFNEAVDLRQKRAIVAMLPELEGKAVLDVGCGTGRLSLFLAAQGARVTGTDFSARMIDEATAILRGYPSTAVEFRQLAVAELRTLERRFDCALSVACLATSGDTREVFERNIETVCALVKGGGYVLLMEPLHRWWPLRRVCRFPARDWITAFGRQGCVLRGADRAIFVPLKLLSGSLPVTPRILRFLFAWGDYLLRLPVVGDAMSDYKILLFQKIAGGEGVRRSPGTSVVSP